MEEIKTAAPAQEPPKKVRRVGTVAFALLLIASGFLLIAQQFLPDFDLLYVFRFAPALLILLGIEVLIYGTNTKVQMKFDWLAIIGSAVTLCIVGAATLAPYVWQYMGPANAAAENAYEHRFTDGLYNAMNDDPALKSHISNLYVAVSLNHYGDNTLQEGDNVYAEACLGNTYYATAEDFAADCLRIYQAAKKADIPVRNYSFYTDTDRSNTARGYRLDFLASQAEALTAAELANQVDETYYYNGDAYDTLEDRLAAERADTGEIANDAFAPETEESAPLEPTTEEPTAEEPTEDIAASELTRNG
ncbi:hypothetical protein [uncultured Gemmiger sp.]|uniref:hypothetical protein n=1 Tax=uncultured Gemmiger sp. TaxID=1623490 RepID=UPI0025D41F02|nr:hypothetical protein [uncultured Gemmiger sp.]